MRKYALVLLAAAVALLPASNAMAYTGTYVPGTGINGTAHDLSKAVNGLAYTAQPPDTAPTGGGDARICIFCHAPHNTYRLSPANGGTGVGAGPQAGDAFDYLPLWNHELTANTTGFEMYRPGPGAPQTGPKASQAFQQVVLGPGSTSLLCLSCHDGSVAVNSYGNTDQPLQSRSGGGSPIFSSYVIGQNQDLQNHHPIGFDYDLVQAVDTEIRSADAALMGGAGTVRDHLYASSTSSATMECATCHSVHNTGNTGESLLWRSDAASRLCLTCHAKGTDPGSTTP